VLGTGEVSYAQAVQEGLFGNVPSSYDLTTLSKYQEVFSQEKNRELFMGMLAVTPSIKLDLSEICDVSGLAQAGDPRSESGLAGEILMANTSSSLNKKEAGNYSPVHESKQP